MAVGNLCSRDSDSFLVLFLHPSINRFFAAQESHPPGGGMDQSFFWGDYAVVRRDFST